MMMTSRLKWIDNKNVHMKKSCYNNKAREQKIHNNRIQEILLKRRRNNPNLIYHNKRQRDYEIQELSKNINVYQFDEHNLNNIKMEFEMIDFLTQENTVLYMKDITLLCKERNNSIIQYLKKQIHTRSIQCITSCNIKDLILFNNNDYVTHNFQPLYIDTNVEDVVLGYLKTYIEMMYNCIYTDVAVFTCIEHAINSNSDFETRIRICEKIMIESLFSKIKKKHKMTNDDRIVVDNLDVYEYIYS